MRLCAGHLEPPPDTRLRAGEELDIPLQPLPLARALFAVSGAGMLACVLQQLLWRQWILATVLVGVSGAVAMMLGRYPWMRRSGPTGLRLTTEGQFRVYCRDGIEAAVGLRPQSLRIGGGVLLILRGSRTYRLWLAPGNVRPEVLAALHRRLGRGSAGVPGLR